MATSEQLADALEQRRLELGLRWDDVADRAGISYETLRNFRAGRPPRPLTKRGIEKALRLKPGSIDAGTLTPLDDTAPPAPADPAAQREAILRQLWTAVAHEHPELLDAVRERWQEKLRRTLDAVPDDRLPDLLDTGE